ncbi:thiol oxidoreductase [bacterium DOLZORAL124_64_63]|nr:MAG: thiol oxidoreductase [bacterium DOLZORAL124_64_63]
MSEKESAMKRDCWNALLITMLILGLGIGLSGCSDDDPAQPEPEDTAAALGGDLTVYDGTSQAYGYPAANVVDLDLHLDGDLVYETGRQSDPNMIFGGLGPTYNNFSCNHCHMNNGRTMPTLWSHGGTGPGYSVFLAIVGTPEGDPLPGYGGILHDQAIFGYQPEARVSVQYDISTHSFADGETYELATPSYTITDWHTGSAPDYEMSMLIPLRHIGLGLMMAVEEQTILDLAAAQESDPDISGRPNYVTNRHGETVVGRIDHKAQSADLTVEVSFMSDTGTTNSMFPHEPYADQDPNAGDDILVHGPEISDEDMNAVDYYLHTIGIPARRHMDDPQIQRGEQIFEEAKCSVCHTPTMHTTTDMVYTIGGTEVSEVVDQEIHPYTDFLLHDMGEELASGLGAGDASPSEWRTAPLWGVGLQEVVDGHSYFLHDGRARNFMEAVMWHYGEGEFSRQYMLNASKEDRDALIAFLKSL